MRTVAIRRLLALPSLSLLAQDHATVRDNAPNYVNNNPGPSLAP